MICLSGFETSLHQSVLWGCCELAAVVAPTSPPAATNAAVAAANIFERIYLSPNVTKPDICPRSHLMRSTEGIIEPNRMTLHIFGGPRGKDRRGRRDGTRLGERRMRPPSA